MMLKSIEKKIRIKNKIICYVLKQNPKRKNHSISMHVDIYGKLHVSAHPKISQSEIDIFLIRYFSWILLQFEQQKKLITHKQPILYEENSQFSFLGDTYFLKFDSYCPKNIIRIHGNHLLVSNEFKKTKSLLIQKLDNWYREEAQNYFEKRLDKLMVKTAWVEKKPCLKIRKMKKKWGNCSSQGVITLNLHLIKIPRHLIDHVILHELCHLQEPNHGVKFYQLLTTVDSDWKNHSQEIKKYIYHIYNLN